MAAPDELGGFAREDLLRLYREVRSIAVVGASDSPDKAAHKIPAYLQRQGYRVIPVNPRGGTILGEAVVPDLAEIEGGVDLVDVFRPPAEAEAVAAAAVKMGARRLWFQPGTETDAAVQLARRAGLEVYFGLCLGSVHGDLGLGPGPD